MTDPIILDSIDALEKRIAALERGLRHHGHDETEEGTLVTVFQQPEAGDQTAVTAPVRTLTPAEVKTMCLQGNQDGDDATLAAMMRADDARGMRGVLDAIRRGEVPGIHAGNPDIVRLRDERDRALAALTAADDRASEMGKREVEMVSELAALRARKVKLPPRDQGGYLQYEYVANLIRAAGVEVGE